MKEKSHFVNYFQKSCISKCERAARTLISSGVEQPKGSICRKCEKHHKSEFILIPNKLSYTELVYNELCYNKLVDNKFNYNYFGY